jgi:ubiquinone/menaquinone biosynthesis C-methylase UbiE
MSQELSMQMIEMIAGGIVAQSVSVAAEIGIADRLAHGPRTTAQLASDADVDAEKLFRLLRFLASRGVFQEDVHGAWSLTPLADMLRSDAPHSMRAGARMFGRMSPVWPKLEENVRTGQCAYSLAFGRPIFEDLAHKPDEAAIFDAAMTSFHGGETDAVLNAYSYDGIAVLADIGCGIGAVMAATLHRYPDMRGILFDQAHVIARTRPHIEAAGVAGQCTLLSGNFFEAVPPGADAYTMRHILHDWSDELCITILGNIRRVIPEDGRLLVIETVVPAGNEPSTSKLFDMAMMALPDGMERSEAQFRTIFGASGFSLTSITPTASPVSIIEARPV